MTRFLSQNQCYLNRTNLKNYPNAKRGHNAFALFGVFIGFVPIFTFLTLFLFSCQDPDLVGLDVQPQGDKMDVIFLDSCSIKSITLKEDSLQSDETSFNLLGSISDPIFGITTAGFYSQFRLPTSNVIFNSPTLDSITVSLAYNGFYGDTTTPLHIKIYEIAENISKDASYYSSHSFLLKPVPLADVWIAPRPHDSILVNGINTAPRMNIRLDNSLGQRFLDASGSSYLADNLNFLEFFKGLYFTAEQSSVIGSIVYFDLLSASGLSKMTLNYNDSLEYNFLINTNCARVNKYSHNYSSAVIPLTQQIVSSPTTTFGDSVVFIQALAGLKTKIIFPYLLNLKNIGALAISKAELTFNIETIGTSNDQFTPPLKLALSAIDDNGRPSFLTDQSEGDTYFGGTYDANNFVYKFNISRYIQQVLSGSKKDNGLYLMVSGSAIRANRLVLKGGKRSVGKICLRIVATKLT